MGAYDLKTRWQVLTCDDPVSCVFAAQKALPFMNSSSLELWGDCEHK